MFEQENFNKNGEKKRDYGEIYAVCRNYPNRCDACTRQGLWQCPANKEQPSEVKEAEENIRRRLL